jgi:hypothetical protein
VPWPSTFPHGTGGGGAVSHMPHTPTAAHLHQGRRLTRSGWAIFCCCCCSSLVSVPNGTLFVFLLSHANTIRYNSKQCTELVRFDYI